MKYSKFEIEKTENKLSKKPHKLRNILIAACIVVCIAAVIFMIFVGNKPSRTVILDSITLYGNQINKVDRIGENANTNMSWKFIVTDPAVQKPILEGKWERVVFANLEEAGEYLAFTPGELRYLPQDCFLHEVSMMKDEHNNYEKNDYRIHYKRETNSGKGRNVYLWAQYVGEDASFQMETTFDIEKIIIQKNIEALLIPEYNGLWWIQDGVGYHLMGDFALDELIKMAESVG